jgi:uncharacterized protein (TIGR02646 family)
MKKLLHSVEPTELSNYRITKPDYEWEQMRNDGEGSGRTVYSAIRDALIKSQGGICGFCEIDIKKVNHSGVEHFHPKSDKNNLRNWALDWGNMLAVCKGGSSKDLGGDHALEPFPENLSCDSHKDKMISSNKLQIDCEGWILSPYDLWPFPCLWRLSKTSGELTPNKEACEKISFKNNKHANTEDLVAHTIYILNLNCTRLKNARLAISHQIEKDKKNFRKNNITATIAIPQIAAKYFRKQWPKFFSSIRFCLGDFAEDYLKKNNYQG